MSDSQLLWLHKKHCESVSSTTTVYTTDYALYTLTGGSLHLFQVCCFKVIDSVVTMGSDGNDDVFAASSTGEDASPSDLLGFFACCFESLAFV